MSVLFSEAAGSTLPTGVLDWRSAHRQKRAFGAFGATACPASDAGLVVVPCGGDSGKTPLIKWTHLLTPLGPKRRNKLLANLTFFNANIGVATGPSGLTVIDCDTPGSLDQLIDRFGPTPLVVKTPRGGFHLYYRSAGERCGPLREDNLVIDVKARGGVVVAPPSIRTTGEHAGKAYCFERGSWAELCSIPRVLEGALPTEFYAKVNRSAASSCLNRCAPAAGKADLARGCDVGQRNIAVFNNSRVVAQHADSQNQLLDAALDFNNRLNPPLGLTEVEKTVASVWRYREEDRLFVAGASSIAVPAAIYDRLAATPNGTDAQMLLLCLRRNHGARSKRGEDFAIVPIGMAREKVILGWGVTRYRNAIATLLKTDLNAITHCGGRCRGDPHRYRLTSASSCAVQV